jgi:hypothetical protein
MANTFKSSCTQNIGTSATQIYAAPTSTLAISTIIGCSLSNKSASPVAVTVNLVRSSFSYSLITGATIPVGGSLVIAGGDEKVVLQAGDTLSAFCATSATAVDTIVSALEIT